MNRIRGRSFRRPTATRLVLALGLIPAAVAHGAGPPAKVPVLLDTDVGTPVDDAFALALAAVCPDVDLRGVTTSGSGAEDRAWIACRFLTHAGRRDVAVAWGRDRQAGDPFDWQIQYRRHPAVVWDRTSKPAKDPAVRFLYEKLKAEPGKVTVVACGPLTNVAGLLAAHPDAKPMIGRVVVVDGASLRADPAAAKAVVAAGMPLTVMPADVAAKLPLNDAAIDRLFAACTAVTFQVQALYELCEQPGRARLADALAVALAGSDAGCRLEPAAFTVGVDGALVQVEAGPSTKARVVGSVDPTRFAAGYVERLAAGPRVLPREPGNVVRPVERGGFPRRVHVVEDYETDIERRWWLTGKLETADVPPGGGRRACRGVLTQDYDDRMGDAVATYRAVVFNPVPGPPMGPNTRLSFRYKVRGTGTLRVQLFSLSNGYHRYLSLTDLPQDRWESCTVDMTQMRRPDGTGGPLAADERIDDIQFYVDPRADLLIDDIILYDAAADGEARPFPGHILFTGWFDTGKQGVEWPGAFDLVKHDPPRAWRAARSVLDERTKSPWVRLHLRGHRPLPPGVRVRFANHVTGAEAVRVALVDTRTGRRAGPVSVNLDAGKWGEAEAAFDLAAAGAGEDPMAAADEVHFLLPGGAVLLLDDVLVYAPGSPPAGE